MKYTHNLYENTKKKLEPDRHFPSLTEIDETLDISGVKQSIWGTETIRSRIQFVHLNGQ